MHILFTFQGCEIGGSLELMQKEQSVLSPPLKWAEYVNLLHQPHKECRPIAGPMPYPGTSSVLPPRFRSVLSSVCWTPDSKGFAVMMTLERLEPGMGSKAGKVTERPRVSLATLTVLNTRFCWALSKREDNKHSFLFLLPTRGHPWDLRMHRQNWKWSPPCTLLSLGEMRE